MATRRRTTTTASKENLSLAKENQPSQQPNPPTNLPAATLLNPLPSFSNPTPMEDTTTETPSPASASAWDSETRTADSSDGMMTRPRGRAVTAEHTSKIVEALLTVGFRIAEKALSLRGKELRRPTSAQLRDMATPTAALTVRYMPLGWAPDGLVDLTDLAAAVSDYALGDEPLVTSKTTVRHVGTPEEAAMPVTAVPFDAPRSDIEYPLSMTASGAPAVSYLE